MKVHPHWASERLNVSCVSAQVSYDSNDQVLIQFRMESVLIARANQMPVMYR